MSDPDLALAAACRRTKLLFEDGEATAVECDVSVLERADLTAVDVLARLALAARRRDRAIRLLGASPALREILALAGLEEVLPCAAPSALEARRQAEERKETGGIQEERDPGDLAV